MNSDRIVYFDFNSLQYASFPLLGFQRNAAAHGYEFRVSNAVPPPLLDPPLGAEWRKILFSVCLFHATRAGQGYYFCIDTRDSCEADSSRGTGYHLPLLEQVRWYFKVNHNAAAIDRDPHLRRHAAKIVPLLPFAPIKGPELFRHVPRLLPNPALGWTFRDVARRINDLRSLPTLSGLRRLRRSAKRFDIVFLSTYYGGGAHAADMRFRLAIMQQFKREAGINALVGFVGKGALPAGFSDFQARPLSLRRYLELLGSARVGVYVRGLHNCISFKFSQMLALGLPVVGQTLYNNAAALLRHENFAEQFADDTPEGIVRHARRLLEDPDALERLSRGNARVFDEHFTPQAVIAGLLDTLGFAGRR